MPEHDAPATVRRTRSEAETVALGRRLGRLLRAGDVILLFGPFGAGKTHLAKGIAAAFGVDEADVNSPSFVLINEYESDRAHGRVPIFHVDLYRLEQPEELDSVGLEDAFDPGALAVVEWAERAAGRLPAEHLALFIEHVAEHERRFRFEPQGARYIELVKALAEDRGDEETERHGDTVTEYDSASSV